MEKGWLLENVVMFLTEVLNRIVSKSETLLSMPEVKVLHKRGRCLKGISLSIEIGT